MPPVSVRDATLPFRRTPRAGAGSAGSRQGPWRRAGTAGRQPSEPPDRQHPGPRHVAHACCSSCPRWMSSPRSNRSGRASSHTRRPHPAAQRDRPPLRSGERSVERALDGGFDPLIDFDALRGLLPRGTTGERCGRRTTTLRDRAECSGWALERGNDGVIFGPFGSAWNRCAGRTARRLDDTGAAEPGHGGTADRGRGRCSTPGLPLGTPWRRSGSVAPGHSVRRVGRRRPISRREIRRG